MSWNGERAPRDYRSHAMRRILCPLAALALLLAACGGGSGGGSGSGAPLSLLLDFRPNAVHTGIYLAKSRGYDKATGVDLRIETPGQTTDALKLLQGGGADTAILDIHDLGLAREKGADLVGVMAVVQRPLAAVLAQPGIRRPRDLEGKRVGVSGLPSDTAVLRSIVESDGGDYDRLQVTTIGFEAVRTLLARRVDAATAFWNVEGVALRARRPSISEFRADDYGAPSYPELVLVTTRSTLDERPEDVAGLVEALQRGYEEAVIDPESAVGALVDAEPGLERAAVAAEFDAVAPAFQAGSPDYGRLDRATLDAWARFDLESGILRTPVDVGAAFDTTLISRADR